MMGVCLLILPIPSRHVFVWPTSLHQVCPGGLRSPSLAKARVDVGDNADAYLVSTDVVSFLGWIEPPSSDSGSQVNSQDGVC